MSLLREDFQGGNAFLSRKIRSSLLRLVCKLGETVPVNLPLPALTLSIRGTHSIFLNPDDHFSPTSLMFHRDIRQKASKTF